MARTRTTGTATSGATTSGGTTDGTATSGAGTTSSGRGGFLAAALVFALLWAGVTVSVAGSVKTMLDEASKVDGGGIPYAVCFLVAGLSVSAVALYSAYLRWTGWSHERFVKSLRVAVIVCLVAAVGCTVWFMFWPGYMNAVGVLGLLVAVSATVWVWQVSRAELAAVPPESPRAQPAGAAA